MEMILAVAFNGKLVVFLVFTPGGFAVMYLKLLRKKSDAVPAKRIRVVCIMEFIPCWCFIWYSESLMRGITSFCNLFWMAYEELFIVNIDNFFGLDCFCAE